MSRKNLSVFVLILIVLLGLFLRFYNFSDWLHFELDQSRDARVIDEALSGGPGELTLLGPKAGGTFLRLAPGFYYLQYLSGLIFGGTPSGIALVVMLLSVLSIPLFYLLLRRFFSEWVSLGLTLVFSVSPFFVMYGRFAWNPNLIPFFTILGFYALLRACDSNDTRKNLWFLLAAFSITFATHFHFLAFLALPTITVLFLLLKRPKIAWQAWAGALLIAFTLYLPMVLNDIETGGANVKEFFGAISEKSTKEEHSLIEKGIRDVSEHALSGIVVTTGFEGATFPSFSFDGKRPVPWLCDPSCDKGKWYGAAGLLVLAFGLFSLGYNFFREKERRKSDFLLLCGIWFAVTFILYVPLAYGIAPRFFLVSAPLFLILLGSLFVALSSFVKNARLKGVSLLILIVLLAGSSLYFLSVRFSELARAGSEKVESAPDRILKERVRVTLEQQKTIVSFLKSRSEETGFPVYMFSEPQYRRALKYLLEKEGVQNDVLGFSGIYREGVYYLIVRTESDVDGAVKKYLQSYTETKRTYFGTLVAIEFVPKPEAIQGERQDFSIPEKDDNSKAPPRYTWRQFFERNGSGNQSEDSSLEESEDKAVDN